jgi:ribonuclease D
VKYEYLATDEALREFCDAISDASIVAFDTEFVSEDCYFPDLCLVQLAAAGQFAIVDAQTISDMSPLWKLLVAPGHVTLVHAGREESRFCRRAMNARPSQLFDTQIAAGLIGLEYPASYGTLILKLLGQSLGKGETRTNWRKRPLNAQQLEYAIQDVTYLEPLYEKITEQLTKLGRLDWLETEMESWQERWESEENGERWRRVSGLSGLSSRQMAIVRELWRWRDQTAERQNVPPRRILRDDLIVELARRRSADSRRIRMVRGMDWRRQQKTIPEIAASIQRGLDVSEEDCPRPTPRSNRPRFNLLGQFLATAVGSMARSAKVAPGLIGSVEDVRELVAHHLGYQRQLTPSLAVGWRAEVVGHVVDQLLDGRLAIRITQPLSEQPLSFEPVDSVPASAPEAAAECDSDEP